MRKILITIFLEIYSCFLFAQTVLTIEGTTTVNTTTGEWLGVNIPRSTPTTFTFRNNTIISENSSGYMLQAGDERINSNNNHLDGEIITGNKFIWNGTDIASTITHGLFTGYNINAVIKYNYLYRVPTGILRKSNGMTDSYGGIAYNIINRTGCIAVVIKGMNGVNIYNNTFYSDEVRRSGSGNPGTDYGLVDIVANDGLTPLVYSAGTKIKNNIFYTVNRLYNISIYNAESLAGFESDYNIFYCEAGTPIFKYLGTERTFAQWQALGYDTHSIVINPDFNNFTDFVPQVRLDYGTDLGTEWQSGLSVNAVWGTTDPETSDQNGTWQVGARVYSIPVTSITVTGAGGANTITTDNGTLQLSAEVLPATTPDKIVIWSIENGTGQAVISTAGLVTAVDNGTVTARATAHDGSGVFGTYVITNSNQVVPVSGIIVTGTGGANNITTENGTLQLSATVLPDFATNKYVTWSIINGTGQATISAGGLVTAVSDGTVTATATANDGSGVTGNLVITNSKSVTGIIVTGADGATTITADNGTLQLTASVLPSNATNNTVLWSIVNGTDLASINSSGLVTAIDNGTFTVRATAIDGSDVFGELMITNSNQIVPVSLINVTGAGESTNITTDNGTLQLSATVMPANATNKTVTWSIIDDAGVAFINSTGLVTALDNGTVTAGATANDGSGVFGTLYLTVSNQVVPVTSITVTGAGGATTITTDNGTLQMTASVFPPNATNKNVTWSIVNGTGKAVISSAGLVTAAVNGTVIVKAAADDGSGVLGILTITISNQLVRVTGITVSGPGGVTSINTDNGSLQLNAIVLPSNATNKTITWSIVNGTGQATIDNTGLVTALDNGTVTTIATANDGSGIFGTLIITNFNQIVPVSGITVSGAGDATTIVTDNGTLQLEASVLPANATDKTVTWSIVSGTGLATIDDSGLLTAVDNGLVTARAIANDGSGIYGTLFITITNQVVPVTSITVDGADGAATINSDNGTLQLSATVLPVNATDRTLSWSIVNGTGQATIDSKGLVKAVDNGTVTALATANDGSGVFGSYVITNSNQIVPIDSITITGAGGATSINTDDGTLLLHAAVFPTNATNKTVTWSIINDTGEATIDSSGLVTAFDNGTVTAMAKTNDGSNVFGILIIDISNQIVLVTGISITGVGGATTITTYNGTLQLRCSVSPANATDKTVTWSTVNGTGEATITSTGLLNAVRNGTITAIATANDGSGVSGALIINISNQLIPVTFITVTGAGGAASITSENGTLELNAEVLPPDATDKTVTWSIIDGMDLAAINSAGIITPIYNGVITAKATANDGSGVYGTLAVTIRVNGLTGQGESDPVKVIVTGSEMKILLRGNNSSWNVGLYNYQGCIVRSAFLESEIITLDVSSLPIGIYIVVLSNGKNLKMAKVFKP